MARAIVITSGKGGVGKSTLTASLGRKLAQSGERTVLLDADFGLNNLLRTTPISTSKMYEWGWYVTFSYKL